MNHSNDEVEEAPEKEAVYLIHIAGRCDFCGQCTDWPNDYCVSCKEEGFDKLHKKKKELEKDLIHA